MQVQRSIQTPTSSWLVRHERIDLGMPLEDWLRQVEVALFNQCSKV